LIVADFSQQLREVLAAETAELKGMLEGRGDISFEPSKLEHEVARLRIENDGLRRRETKAVEQRDSIRNEMGWMEEELDILKALLEKSKEKSEATIQDWKDRYDEQQLVHDKQANHFKAEIQDLKEQIEELENRSGGRSAVGGSSLVLAEIDVNKEELEE
ncbi:hypothetical protein PROFUN_16448, partial [Planoprotostelium fungivorum]